MSTQSSESAQPAFAIIIWSLISIGFPVVLVLLISLSSKAQTQSLKNENSDSSRICEKVDAALSQGEPKVSYEVSMKARGIVERVETHWKKSARVGVSWERLLKTSEAQEELVKATGDLQSYLRYLYIQDLQDLHCDSNDQTNLSSGVNLLDQDPRKTSSNSPSFGNSHTLTKKTNPSANKSKPKLESPKNEGSR